ncbi:MAG: MraY family glycosyltransferase [Phycisphaerales bacterium]
MHRFQPEPIPTGDSSVEVPEVSLDATTDLLGFSTDGHDPFSPSAIVHGYLFVFVIAFLVTLLLTPLVRKLAFRAGIVDWPDSNRKMHREPVAYLGGVAVFLGLFAGIAGSYLFDGYVPGLTPIPLHVVIAMVVILFTGLADDILHWDPYTKVGGMFIAAAVLAWDDAIGGRVAEGLLAPFQSLLEASFGIVVDFHALPIIPGVWDIDLVYWTGAFIIAAFVLIGCNAANLLDGLDGLLTGSVSIMASALLAISVLLAAKNYGELTGARVALCFALLGATLGFLPHNFRPATIFLGDAGSLLLGFSVMVIVLLLGENGQTHLVFAGLIVFALPLIDMTLAIIRRRLAGLPIFTPDRDHLHHMLSRTRLRVVGSVFVLYAISGVFALLAVTLVFMRARLVYAIGLVFAGFIVVTGIKVARRSQRIAEIERIKSRRDAEATSAAPTPSESPRPASAKDPAPAEVSAAK